MENSFCSRLKTRVCCYQLSLGVNYTVASYTTFFIIGLDVIKRKQTESKNLNSSLGSSNIN